MFGLTEEELESLPEEDINIATRRASIAVANQMLSEGTDMEDLFFGAFWGLMHCLGNLGVPLSYVINDLEKDGAPNEVAKFKEFNDRFREFVITILRDMLD